MQRPKILLLGKFCPPTMGHKLLIDFAREFADIVGGDLTVFVATLPREPIPGHLRADWIARHFRGYDNVKVIHANEVVPQYPEEHPDFWAIWKDYISRRCGPVFDYVVASETYGATLAEVVGAKFVPCDINRDVVSISATAVRRNVKAKFDYLLPEARNYFRKQVVIFGPESCGKSTMAQKLASCFDVPWTPEWAREYLNQVGQDFTLEKMTQVMHGQLALERSAKLQAGPLLITDTGLLATPLWAEALLGECPQWAYELAAENLADLYLVLDTSVPFVQDGTRYEGRTHTTQQFVDRLEQVGATYEVITDPDYENRFFQATDIIETYMAKWFKPIIY